MKKTGIGVCLLIIASLCQAQSNIYEVNGNVGIGRTAPATKLHLFDETESRPGGVSAPSKASLKLSRAGTVNYSWPESAEFRLGHGGEYIWGSKLELYVNGANNMSDIPDQHAMTWQYNGYVGVGTGNPRSLLDVGKYVRDGVISTALARMEEGDTQGEGTFLGVKAWETNVPGSGGPYNGKAFSLEHSFYGQVNNSINFFRGFGVTGGFMTFATQDGTEKMRILANGNVGIGTTNPGEKLSVNGKVRAHELKVESNPNTWPDYVFKSSYQLMPLNQVEAFIKTNGHLPEVPSAKDVEEKGIEVGANQALLLKKIEELTLHIIELEKRIALQEEKTGKKRSK